ncbi:ferredoxin [Pseudonocardia xishanensis]|uniref:Ferredoxin n=1 Tax=Pseudonocardia xishanensis TaxID=630995 RepID=A0ABP8RJB9_9PSEU
MPYFIAGPCIDVMDKACTEVCPVDCIYEGARKLYINPDECIDCGACEPACPVEAITSTDSAGSSDERFAADNALFFSGLLPGRDEPIGMPGGADEIGPVGVDTELVRAEADRESVEP